MLEERWSGVGQDTESRETVALLNQAIQHRQTTTNEMISTGGREGGRERGERERKGGEAERGGQREGGREGGRRERE